MKTLLLSATAALLATAVPFASTVAAQTPRVRPIITAPLQAYAIPEGLQPQVPAPRTSRFQAAPIPNRDVDAPSGPRASNDPQVSASLFNRRDQFRGDAISPNSSAQIDQERRLRPGAGFTLKMPLQQQPQSQQ